jgi:hypothetical protein
LMLSRSVLCQVVLWVVRRSYRMEENGTNNGTVRRKPKPHTTTTMSKRARKCIIMAPGDRLVVYISLKKVMSRQIMDSYALCE